MDTPRTIQTGNPQENEFFNRIIMELNSRINKDKKVIGSQQLKINNQQEEIEELTNKVKYLNGQLEWFKRQVFGKKSERVVNLPQNNPVLTGFEFPEIEEEIKPEKIKIPAHIRTKKKQGKGKFIVEYPDSLERVEFHVDVPESERILSDGRKLVKIGEDRSEKLAFKPGEYYIKVFVRPKYSVPNDPILGVIQEPMPPCILPGAKLDSSFFAHIVEEKYAFHMPLYRIEEKLRGRDIRVTRQLMSQAIVSLGQKVLPLVKLMTERTLKQGVIFTDDTPLKLRVKEKGKCQEARIYAYIGGLPNAPPYHIYHFTLNRQQKHPIDFLQDFKGFFHADAYGAYKKIAEKDDVFWAACWAHARRKFENALTGAPDDFSLWVIRQMRYLFLFERIAWESSAERRLEIRKKKEEPLVKELFWRFTDQIKSGKLLPKSKLAVAIGYMQCRKEHFLLYLNNPDLRLENNTAERGLRKLTIGRKNWLFVGSERAGHSMAALLSLVQTCRALGIKPREYLEDVFNRLLDHPHSRLAEFLPDRWQEIRLTKDSAKKQ